VAAQRYGFIDWFRGLACVLMIQTHAYDAWTAEPYREGFFFWMVRPQLGGFPARMFLLLAGVSLAMRYAGDLRRGVPEWTARAGGVKRGLEVFLIGYIFRIFEWGLSGFRLKYLDGVFKVDVLQCIGLSLMISAALIGPRHLVPRRFPVLAAVVTAAVVLGTAALQRLSVPAWLPGGLAGYLWPGAHAQAAFPILPWLSYTLTGAIVGIYWMRAIAADAQRGAGGAALTRAMWISFAVGLVLAVFGQWAQRLDVPLYRTSHNPLIATPVSYFYRLGMCLVGAALAYAYERRFPLSERSPLKLMGQASLTVYVVHVELVYGIASYPIKRRLSLPWATVLWVLLTADMVYVAWWRLHRYRWRLPWPLGPGRDRDRGERKPASPQAPGTAPAQAPPPPAAGT
jgi:uncharacterized membrane protein